MNQRDKPDLITNSTCLKRAFHSKSSLVINIDSKTFLSNVVKFTPLLLKPYQSIRSIRLVYLTRMRCFVEDICNGYLKAENKLKSGAYNLC